MDRTDETANDLLTKLNVNELLTNLRSRLDESLEARAHRFMYVRGCDEMDIEKWKSTFANFVRDEMIDVIVDLERLLK